MTKAVPIKMMDAFCDRLFRVLDRADLLPLRLNEAAHAFEKHGRLLAGLLGRYDRIEAAFDEWETRALRGIDNKFRREQVYPYFQELRTWMTEAPNRELFEGEGRKDNLNHFKRSLYGRLYTWLYPRRRLVLDYVQSHIGNVNQFEPEAIHQDFITTVQFTQEKLGEIDSQAVVDAQAYLIMNSGRFKKWKAKSEFDNDLVEEDIEVQSSN